MTALEHTKRQEHHRNVETKVMYQIQNTERATTDAVVSNIIWQLKNIWMRMGNILKYSNGIFIFILEFVTKNKKIKETNIAIESFISSYSCWLII